MWQPGLPTSFFSFLWFINLVCLKTNIIYINDHTVILLLMSQMGFTCKMIFILGRQKCAENLHKIWFANIWLSNDRIQFDRLVKPIDYYRVFPMNSLVIYLSYGTWQKWMTITKAWQWTLFYPSSIPHIFLKSTVITSIVPKWSLFIKFFNQHFMCNTCYSYIQNISHIIIWTSS
jgi:hypothetical protein